VFRLRLTSVSGFPRMWLNVRLPCAATCSPLLEPDVRISRIRLSRKTLAPRHTQGDQREKSSQGLPSQVQQMLVKRLAFRLAERPLTATLKMGVEPSFDKSVELAEGFARKAMTKVV